jgi:hypothetical protein
MKTVYPKLEEPATKGVSPEKPQAEDAEKNQLKE